MSNNRAKKRPRVETVNDGEEKEAAAAAAIGEEDEDKDVMMAMMMMTGNGPDGEDNRDGDDEAREKERARKRRERMNKIQQKETQQPSMSVSTSFEAGSQRVSPNSGGDGTTTTTAANSEKGEKQQPAVSIATFDAGSKSNSPSNKGGDGQDKDDDDSFDMFSSSVSPVVDKTSKSMPTAATNKTDDWQDEEGYYKAVIGETLELNGGIDLKVMGVVGKGVFSTVLKCSTDGVSTAPKGENLPDVVALKCIRHNETMSKAAENEVRFLQNLQHPHVVSLLLPQKSQPPLEHRGHICMVFPFEQYNLRDVLAKFGKGVGLSLSGVQSYFGQMLSALQHLSDRGLIHADLKPDNILVSRDFSTVQLCDFGSAMEVGSADAVPTPYLVSRFYRAPEIILGMVPSPALDLWSIGVTVAELFLGTVLLNGRSNSDMLRVMMECLGPFSAKVLRHHLIQVQKYGGGIPGHFKQEVQSVYVYLQQTNEIAANGKIVVKEVSLQKFPTKPLMQTLLKAKSSTDSRLKVRQFADLLGKVLCLDATKRIAVVNAMKHEFFQAVAPQQA